MRNHEDDVIDRFMKYSKAFETLSPDAVIPYYHEPCLFLSPQGVRVLPTHADVSAFFRGVMADLTGKGYESSHFSDLTATVLGKNLAVVRGIGIWRGAKGDVLRRFGLMYTFCRPPVEWAIVVAAVHDVETDAGA